MTYYDPAKMTRAERARIDAWLVANGARWHASTDHPVIVAGRWIWYGATCKRDARSIQRNDWVCRAPDPDTGAYDTTVCIKRRRVRVRVPLSAIPAQASRPVEDRTGVVPRPREQG